jgi:glycerol-3-phosphate acyltransferase PlsY
MSASLQLSVACAFALGYLLGSIPFGLILTRFAGIGDIRRIGSGNIGATNVLRTGYKGLAATTLLLDALKGTSAVLAGAALFTVPGAATSAEAVSLAAALGAFLGHIFPAWLGFQGGKGVATYIGVVAGLYWPAALVFCAVWLAVATLSRYSSLSALAASGVTPLFLLAFDGARLALVVSLLTALLFFKHHANIQRLLTGQESKIGAKT